MVARLLVVLLVWLTASALAQPAPVVQLDPRQSEVDLSGHLEMWIDPQHHSSPAELPDHAAWTPVPDMPTPGYSDAAIWLRLRVTQTDASQEWRLSVPSPLIDEVRLWSPRTDGRLHEQRSGPAVARPEWPVQDRMPTFAVRLPAGTHTLYLRLSGRYFSLSSQVRLWTPEAFRRHSNQESLLYGAYFGVFIVVVVLQLSFWLLLRERGAGWYVLYTLMLLLGQALGAGHLLQWLNLPSTVVGSLVGIYLCLAPAAVGRLTAIWLNLRAQLPRLGRAYETVIYGIALLSSALVLDGQSAWGAELSQAATILVTLLSLGLAGWMKWRGLHRAGIYLLVFSPIDIGILTRFLRNLGLLEPGFVADYAIFIGIVLHLLAMSLYFIYRYSTLRKSLEQEREARTEQREFVNMVSHEFRTPLAIINTSIQQLAANLDAPPEKSQQRAHNIRHAVQRMNLLLDDYLSLDRFDSLQQPVQRTACDFFDVIEEAASDWPLDQIRITLHNLPAQFVCDPDLMRIVLRNLLANAVRHAPPGTPVELEVSGLPNGELRLRVRDQGPGIPADELPRLFQRYFRGRAAQGTPGAGLGLYLVKRIVEGHGGRISVHSAPDAGTTFTVNLPAISA